MLGLTGERRGRVAQSKRRLMSSAPSAPSCKLQIFQMSDPSPGGTYGLSSIEETGTYIAPTLSYLPPRPRSYRPRIALIGCGGISEYHLRAYVALGLDVVALCNRTREKAEKHRAEFFPGAQVYTDYRDVLARDDIEVIDVTLHPAERAAVIESALQRRKHVLSQKPFVLDLDEGRRLADLADAQG